MRKKMGSDGSQSRKRSESKRENVVVIEAKE